MGKVKKCKFSVCSKKLHARGFCSTHYAYWRAGIFDLEGNLYQVLRTQNKSDVFIGELNIKF